MPGRALKWPKAQPCLKPTPQLPGGQWIQFAQENPPAGLTNSNHFQDDRNWIVAGAKESVFEDQVK